MKLHLFFKKTYKILCGYETFDNCSTTFLRLNIQHLEVFGIVHGVDIGVNYPVSRHAVNVVTGHVVQDLFFVGQICRASATKTLKIVRAVGQYSCHNSDQ